MMYDGEITAFIPKKYVKTTIKDELSSDKVKAIVDKVKALEGELEAKETQYEEVSKKGDSDKKSKNKSK